MHWVGWPGVPHLLAHLFFSACTMAFATSCLCALPRPIVWQHSVPLLAMLPCILSGCSHECPGTSGWHQRPINQNMQHPILFLWNGSQSYEYTSHYYLPPSSRQLTGMNAKAWGVGREGHGSYYWPWALLLGCNWSDSTYKSCDHPTWDTCVIMTECIPCWDFTKHSFGLQQDEVGKWKHSTHDHMQSIRETNKQRWLQDVPKWLASNGRSSCNAQ